MKSPAFATLILFLASGCAVQPMTEGPPPDPAGDAAPDAAGPTADAVSADQVMPDRTDAASPDAGRPLGPQGPDALPPAVDSGPDGAAADGRQDADAAIPPGPDAAGPDAVGADAADVARGDAGQVEGGNADPVCASPSASCREANAADQAIRDTFVKPCAPEDDRKCGGVWRGVVETQPMICRAARWRLAGYWTGIQWVPAYQCSMGCGAAGKLCDP